MSLSKIRVVTMTLSDCEKQTTPPSTGHLSRYFSEAFKQLTLGSGTRNWFSLGVCAKCTPHRANEGLTTQNLIQIHKKRMRSKLYFFSEMDTVNWLVL